MSAAEKIFCVQSCKCCPVHTHTNSAFEKTIKFPVTLVSFVYTFSITLPFQVLGTINENIT